LKINIKVRNKIKKKTLPNPSKIKQKILEEKTKVNQMIYLLIMFNGKKMDILLLLL